MVTAAQPEPDRFHIPSLDGIRASSFLLVFAAHAGLADLVPGGFGVTVFFFLSGYLITTLLRLEAEQYGSTDMRRFYLRRTLRILPPFYFVLFLAEIATVAGLLPGHFHLAGFVSQAAMFSNYRIAAHGYDEMAAGTGVLWSLAVEEHFYLVFPWLYVGLRRVFPSRAQQALALLGLCTLVLVWRCVLVRVYHTPPDRTYLTTDARFDALLFGCTLAIYGNPALDRKGQSAPWTWKYLLLPAGIATLLFTFVYRGAAFRETFRYTLQGLALFPVFIVAVRDPDWFPIRFLSNRWFAFVGTLSYSLYLVHHTVLFWLARYAISGILRAAVGLMSSLLLAYAIYRCIEVPSARLRRRLASRMRPHRMVARQTSALVSPSD